MSGYSSEPISLEEWQRMQAERERDEEVGLARSGDYYTLGERRAKRELMAEQARVVSEYEAKVRRQALEEEHARRQGEVESWAEQHFTPEELEAIGEAFQTEQEAEAPRGESWEAAERRWRKRAEAALTRKQEREQGRVLTDARIREMDADEYSRVWDVEKGTPKPGFRYEPTLPAGDDGPPGASMSEMLAAAGIGGAALDLRSPR